jgi:hypothetical protein
MDENGAHEEEPERLPAKLEPWARFTSMGLGVALGSIGGWAVVTDSGNQAGTLGVFLMGLVLLVMGLQNTPLTGITAGGGASFATTEQQVQRTKELATEKLDEGEPDEAKAVIDTAEALNPKILERPVIQGLQFEATVGLALNALIPEGTRSFGLRDAGADYMIQTRSGRALAVDVKFGRHLNLSDLKRLVGRVRGSRTPDGGKFAGLLLVTNRPVRGLMPQDLSKALGLPMEIAVWDGGSNATPLAHGLELLIARVETGQSPR